MEALANSVWFKRLGLAIGLLALASLLMVVGPHILPALEDARLHPPNLALLFAQSPMVQVHTLAALACVALGGVMLAARKGRLFHRTAGWFWVALMALTAGSSLFIVGLNGDVWSLVHLISGWTLVTLPLGIWAARKHRVVNHRKAMTGLYWGACILAGAFTFIPGRLMFEVLFG